MWPRYALSLLQILRCHKHRLPSLQKVSVRSQSIWSSLWHANSSNAHALRIQKQTDDCNVQRLSIEIQCALSHSGRQVQTLQLIQHNKGGRWLNRRSRRAKWRPANARRPAKWITCLRGLKLAKLRSARRWVWWRGGEEGMTYLLLKLCKKTIT